MLPGLLDDGEEGTANGYTEGEAQALTFEEIRNPYTFCLLIEPELFLEHKVVVVAEWKADQGLSKAVSEGKDERVCDLAGEASRCVSGEPGASNCPELGVYIVVENGEIEGLAEEAGEETELSFGSPVCLTLVESLGLWYVSW